MGKTVLVVDDSTSLRNLVKYSLESKGYHVIEAENGSAALGKLDKAVNLVITDINMPVMNGIDLIRNIRQNSEINKATPIIVMTTESEQALKDEAKSLGATGWIVKPFNEEKLLSVLKKIIG